MLYGYARVSRGDRQDPAAQLRSLASAGCERIFQEEASGASNRLLQREAMIDALEPGDVVIVWKLDRLSRSLSDLLAILARIDAAGAGFRSLTEAIDTTTPAGRLMMQMLGAFAEFEREIIRERTLHGLDNARRAGRHIGRKPSLSPQQCGEIIRLIEEGRGTPAHAADLFNVSPSTVKRVLRTHREKAAA